MPNEEWKVDSSLTIASMLASRVRVAAFEAFDPAAGCWPADLLRVVVADLSARFVEAFGCS